MPRGVYDGERRTAVKYWREYNPNPVRGKRVGDCTIRALSKALEKDRGTVCAAQEQKPGL